MFSEPRGALKVERGECYSLLRYVREYAWELRALSSSSGAVSLQAALVSVYLGLLLAVCVQFHLEHNVWREIALVPAIGLLTTAIVWGAAGMIRQNRHRRMQVRVVRRCLEQLTSVAESLVALSFSEKFMVAIALNDARLALETIPA